MSTNGITAIGTTISFNSYVISEPETPPSGSRSANVQSVLTCDSASKYADKIVGSFEAGQVTFRCIYDPSTGGNYDLLDTDFHADTKATLECTFPTGSKMSGQAVIQSLGDPVADAADGVIKFDVTFERAGAHTHTGV